MISVVIPAWNEERALPGTLKSVFSQATPCEVIVADGGSSDATYAIAAADTRIQLVSAPKGRASQMNAGAQRARGEWILFLHADTWLPPGALSAIAALPPEVAAGCFRHRFSGRDWRLRLISRLHDWRFSITGIIYGDQAMFVRRALFERLGGFPAVAHLEDVLFSERLVRVTQPRMLELIVDTESRKFEQMGIWKSLGRVLAILVCHELRLPVPTRFFRDVR
ncbi:MAG: TIGR04283 family arsenosugar biosynthesis glycosyltransferase [Burkholderiales bacterium]|nr:TIGR04283 family arsenosugar biosynthesis glycosyltransferase [Burkholderiales bacterium]